MNNIIYENNMNALKEKQKYIYNTINEISVEMINYKIISNSNIDVLLYKNNLGNYIQYTSYFNPEVEAKRYIEKLDFSFNRSLFIVLGISLGVTLENVLNNLNERSKVICYERDILLLKEVLKRKDFSEYILSDKLFFAVKDNNLDSQIFNLIDDLLINAITNIQTIYYNVYDADYIRDSKEFVRLVYEKRDFLQFAIGNNIDDTLVGLDNYLENIFELVENPGIKEVIEQNKYVYKNKPAIIVASGPSLNKNIKDLKEAEGKSLILSCDGSVEALKKNDIHIDGMGSVERIRKTYEAFYEGRNFDDNIVLVAPTIVDPNIIKTFKTKKLLFLKQGDCVSWLINKITKDKKGSIPYGMSVSHILFMVAYNLGCNPIILVGQDLAYSSDGYSHVKEASEVLEKIEPSKVQVYVKDINGKDIPSTNVWKKFLQLYEDILENCNIDVIDATEGGAYIKGTKVMNLKDAIAKYCTKPVDNLRTIINKTKVDKKYIKEMNYSILKEIDLEIKRYNLLRHKVTLALEENKKAMKYVKQGIKTQEQLDEIYDAIDYAGEKIPKDINRNYMQGRLFYYAHLCAVNKINSIKTDKFTYESIKENLIILEEYLNILHIYSIKTLKILYKHYNKIRNKMEKENLEIPKCFKNKKYIEKYIKDSKYDLPLHIRYGYNPKK